MSYTVAITKTGQMTLPKQLRLFLGVDGAKTVQIEQRKDEVVIKKRLSEAEFRAEIEKHIGAKTRAIMADDRRRGIKTTRQMLEEIYENPAEKQRLEEEYGANPSTRYA